MDVIYGDSLLLLNGLIDYFLLLAAARLCPLPPRRLRLALGAAFGGLYALMSALPPMALLRTAAAKLLCGVLMALIAFGGQGRLARSCAVFFGVSAAFGGAVWAISMLLWGFSPRQPYIAVSLPLLAVSFSLCYAVITLVFRRVGARAQRRLVTVELRLGDRRSAFPALEDTGNSLYEPMSGKRVITAEASAVLPLLPEGTVLTGAPEADLSALARCEALRGRLRLIPYAAVGVKSGLLLGLRPDSITADGLPAQAGFVALSPTPLSPDGEYRGLI